MIQMLFFPRLVLFTSYKECLTAFKICGYRKKDSAIKENPS